MLEDGTPQDATTEWQSAPDLVEPPFLPHATHVVGDQRYQAPVPVAAPLRADQVQDYVERARPFLLGGGGLLLILIAGALTFFWTQPEEPVDPLAESTVTTIQFVEREDPLVGSPTTAALPGAPVAGDDDGTGGVDDGGTTTAPPESTPSTEATTTTEAPTTTTTEATTTTTVSTTTTTAATPLEDCEVNLRRDTPVRAVPSFQAEPFDEIRGWHDAIGFGEYEGAVWVAIEADDGFGWVEVDQVRRTNGDCNN